MPYVSGFDRDQLMCCSWDAFVDKESIARQRFVVRDMAMLCVAADL